jgi:hypothetical protein
VETFSGPLNSATSRIFLNADYRLKGYCAEGGPEGLRPDLVYLFDERERQRMGSEAVPEMLRVRYWLTPDQVHMQSSPDGSVVRFGEANIRLRSQVLDAPGADPASQAFLSAASEGYAREISSPASRPTCTRCARWPRSWPWSGPPASGAWICRLRT